jgi:hypothetical protein
MWRINPQDKMINKEHPWKNGLFVSIQVILPSVAWRQKKDNLVMVRAAG